MSMELTPEQARTVVGREDPDWSCVDYKISGQSRWSVRYNTVWLHKPSGKHYRFVYSEGATEEQDEAPYQYDDGPITVPEVEAVEKVVTAWVDKEQDG